MEIMRKLIPMPIHPKDFLKIFSNIFQRPAKICGVFHSQYRLRQWSYLLSSHRQRFSTSLFIGHDFEVGLQEVEMNDKQQSHFVQWALSLGYNLKELGKAAARLGFDKTWRSNRAQDHKALTASEKLAMSAVSAGLPEWHPDHVKSLNGVKKMIEASGDIDFSPISGKTRGR